MKTLRIIPIALAALLLLGLLAACGGQTNPTTGETTADPIVTTIEAPTEDNTDPTAAGSTGLLDLALIDRLFSMTYADYCEEEGQTVEPEDFFEGSVYCRFSKYGNSTFFFDFDYDSEAPKVKGPDSKPGGISFAPTDLLAGRQSVTLGELKQWLDSESVSYDISDFDGLDCIFSIGKYALSAGLDSENDGGAVRSFYVRCMENFTN